MANRLELAALRIQQRRDVPLFVFGIDGRLVHRIASISLANRSVDGTLSGYQRPRVKKHIQEILDYLKSPEAILPNSIVVAFDDRVRFVADKSRLPAEWGTPGKLSIPLPRNATEPRAGWIVDGQQRATALAELPGDHHFPVVVSAFVSKSRAMEREQFLLVNRTKALPRDLVREILPSVSTELPKTLTTERLAAQVIEKLRFEEHSPFYQRIRGLGASGEGCNISQNAIARVIKNSIKRKGVLLEYYDSSRGLHDIEQMVRTLSAFYEGVRRTWPEEWSSSPRQSRLVHGVGIVSLGGLMDRMMIEVDPNAPRAAYQVARRMRRIEGECAWAAGRWPRLGLEWSDLQNTSTDISRLTEYLIKAYSSAR